MDSIPKFGRKPDTSNHSERIIQESLFRLKWSSDDHVFQVFETSREVFDLSLIDIVEQSIDGEISSLSIL